MLLALRYQSYNGLLQTVQATLDPRELSMIADRPRSNGQPSSKTAADKTAQKGHQLKRNQDQINGDGRGTGRFIKRTKPTGKKTTVSDNDEEDSLASPPSVENARGPAPTDGRNLQQQTPTSPSIHLRPSTPQPTAPPAASPAHPFTSEQAHRIRFIWKYTFDGPPPSAPSSLPCAKKRSTCPQSHNNSTRQRCGI